MKESEFGMAIPHLFRCPISLDLFTDPVTLCTGQTYDRPNIEKWLQLGNLTCPVTMQRLHDPSIVPNHTLRHLIEQWLQLGHRIDPDYFEAIDPDRSLIALKQGLESNHASVAETKKLAETLEGVRGLCDQSPSRSSCLVRLGFLPVLLELIFGTSVEEYSKYSSDDRGKFVEEALSCVIKLLQAANGTESSASLNILNDESKLESFLALFEHGNATIKTGLCRIVDAISSSSETKELCITLGENTRFLRELSRLLRHNDDASEAGIKAVWSLSSMEPSRHNLVREGIVDGLIEHTGSTPLALVTLERFVGLEVAREALIGNPDGVSCLVKMVFRVCDLQGSESSMNILMAICQDSVRAREDAIAAGVLTQLLLLLQSQCSGRIKTKARMLLKLLRSKRDENPKSV